MAIVDDIKDVTQTLEGISENGKDIVENGANVINSLNNNTSSATISTDAWTARAYFSTTKKLVWAITLFSMLMFVAVLLSQIFMHVDVSYILPYVIGIWVPVIITYCTKSYLEKKNLPSMDTITK